MAMMDTMGQAAALTGGYGSSYSQMVGQQAYQGYLQQLNDKVPELYQLALDQYNREGQELYNQYGLYADRENQDYGRYRDSVSDYYTDLNYLTEDARYKSEDDYSKWYDKTNLDYGIHRDSVEDYYTDLKNLTDEARYLSEDEYSKYIDAYNRLYGEHRDAVSDWEYDQTRADDNYWKLYDRDYTMYDSDRTLDFNTYWNEKEYEYNVARDKVEDEQWEKSFNASQKSSNPSNNPDDNPGTNYTAPEGWGKAEIKAFQEKAGISVDGIWGPESQKAYDEYYGGSGLNGARKDEIYALVEGVLSNKHLSASFKPDDWIKANGAFKSDEERAYAREIFTYLASLN